MSSSRPAPDRYGLDTNRPTEVSRPRRTLFERFESEGMTWDGQAHLVGEGGVLPVWVVVTTERLILADRDTVLMEAPRSWLVPAPIRVQDGGVRISITPEGVVPSRASTERLLLMINEGRGPATQLVAILTGRSRLGPVDAETPQWKDGVGAGRASSLPPLPAFERGDEPGQRTSRDANDPEVRGVAPLGSWRPVSAEDANETNRSPFYAPDPEPVVPASRAGRFLADRPIRKPQSVADRESDDTPAPSVIPIQNEREKRRAGAGIWATRVAMLAVVVLVAGWFARPYLPEQVNQRLPEVVRDETALRAEPTTAVNPDSADQADEGDGTNGANSDPSDIMPTEVALGLGGATSPIETTDDNDGEANPANGGVVEPTASVNEEDQSAESENPSQAEPAESAPPTEAAAPNEADAPAATTEPEAATEQPVATTVPDQPAPDEVVEPTEEPLTQPTVIPESDDPTSGVGATTVADTGNTVPANEKTGADVPRQDPAAEPADAPAASTLEPQAPSVDPESPTEQQFADQGFRYSVNGAATGSSLDDLPEVAQVTYGEWVVLSVTGENWTGSEQVFDMSRFTLMADGEALQLDVGNSWIASLLDLTPSYGNTDAILWAPGEQHQFVLAFLAPNDAESLELQVGDQQLDLSELLDSAPGLQNLDKDIDVEMIEATVIDVIDGETIVIEKDGVSQTVRYLGIDVPSEQGCFASESTEANRQLVEGRTIRIERQATNVDAQGNWVRDVWVEQDDGRFALVAHQLVSSGAAEADISEPNTRFASWLRSAEAAAQAEERGMWSTCSSADVTTSMTVATIPMVSGDRRMIS
jgi:micrococcal nuclease